MLRNIRGYLFCMLRKHLGGAEGLKQIFLCIMRIFLSGYRQVQPQLNFPAGITTHMDSFSAWRKEKVVVVMGATGTGKSRLSIDLATHFPAEIVNSDKMQVYKGLDIVTNKITEEERCGVPHHLLGVVDPESEFTAPHFRYHALKAVESITKRHKLPVIAGGSNSYIEALVDDEDYEFRSRYDCLFLWVDVSLRVLYNFVSERVDSMVEVGLVDEVRKMFDHNADYTRGIRRAIGVPELDRYLRAEPNVDKETRDHLLQEAIDQIKVNNCKLACCQLQKIHRLASLSHWNIHRIDATEVFQQRGKDVDDTWERLVAAPSIRLLQEFLYNNNEYATAITAAAPMTAPVTAVAASL